MGNGVTWGIKGASNGATPENKNKTLYYYIAGATILLLIVKLLTSNYFREIVDWTITYLPFVILLSVAISSVLKFRKNPAAAEEIKKNALHKTFYLLLITLVFYILYSPASFAPILTAGKKFGRLFSMENYFLALSYACVLILALAGVIFFVKVYQKSKGTYTGTLRQAAHSVFYPVFFIFVLVFISSIFTYPSAYAPVTGYVGDKYYALFLRPENTNPNDNLANARISTLKSALSSTYENLKAGMADSNEKLATTITDTKVSLDSAISRVNKDLKNNLTDDITDKLDLSGGTLTGDLTLEGTLDITDTTTALDILPDADDSYDLGSVSKGWDNAYIHTLHGSSILTVGDAATSHSMTDSDDILVSGDLEVNGTVYFDGDFELGSLSGLLKAASGTVGVASGGTDYENPLTFGYSLERTNDTIILDGDADAPGASKYYGTDGAGAKGWQTVSAGTTDHAALLSNLAYATSGHTGDLPLGAFTITTSNTGLISNLNADLWDGYQFADYINQAVKTTSSPSFAGLALTGAMTTNNSTKVTNLNADTTDGYSLNQDVQSSASPAFAGMTLNGDLNMTNDSILNIGNAGTDFGSDGGLTLAANLAVTGGNITSSSGAISFADENLSTTGTFSAGNSTIPMIIGGTLVGSDLTLKTTSYTGTAADGSNMLFQTGSNGLTEAMKIDYQGITYINSLQSGAQNFEADAGVVQWVDMAVTSAAASTVESYSAMLDGTAVLTVYGVADGSSGLTTGPYVGIGTTTPVSLTEIQGGLTTTGSILTLSSKEPSTVINDILGRINFRAALDSAGTDAILTGASIAAIAENTFSASVNETGLQFSTGASEVAVERMRIDHLGNVGIGDTTPDTTLKVVGSLCVESDANNCAGAVAGTIYAINTTVQGADYAEYFYTKNTDLQAGEAVCIDPEKENAVKRCTNSGDNNIMGIVSNNPSIVGNTQDGYVGNQNYKIVGMMGQISGKVSNENGAITIGDSLTSASTPGYMRKANAGESTVGVALQNFNSKNGSIQVLISRRNKSLTVEKVEESVTARIAEMNVGDQVNKMVADAKAQLQTDADLKFTNYDSQIVALDTLTATLQAQIAELQAKTNAELNLAQIDLNTADLALMKQTLGLDVAEPGDLSLIGKIAAKEIAVEEMETGKLVMTVLDPEAATIGAAEILAIETDIVDVDGADTPDADGDGVPDGDGVDDVTGTDGRSVVVETTAVTADSKVFLTPKAATADPLAVTKIKDGESFTVEVANPVAADFKFDWWMVDVKN